MRPASSANGRDQPVSWSVVVGQDARQAARALHDLQGPAEHHGQRQVPQRFSSRRHGLVRVRSAGFPQQPREIPGIARVYELVGRVQPVQEPDERRQVEHRRTVGRILRFERAVQDARHLDAAR